jgi:PhnB protein
VKIDIVPYLTFSGNCREAMKFYQNCLGGKLYFQTLGDSPEGVKKLPGKMKHYILHASLIQEALILTGTDLVSDSGLHRGNSVSLMLNCTSEKEIRKLYKRLSYGGLEKYPLENTFCGAIFGSFKDRYGHDWILNYNKTD